MATRLSHGGNIEKCRFLLQYVLKTELPVNLPEQMFLLLLTKIFCIRHEKLLRPSQFVFHVKYLWSQGRGAFFKKNFKTPLDRNIIIQSSYEVEILQKDTPVENMRTGNIFM